jgi:hypothetical protein
MANARPVTQIRLGVVRASIWANETTNGTRYSVTVGRLYMKDSEWKTSSSFGHDELLVLCKTLDMAYMWIAERNATRRSAGSGATAVEDMGNEGQQDVDEVSDDEDLPMTPPPRNPSSGGRRSS